MMHSTSSRKVDKDADAADYRRCSRKTSPYYYCTTFVRISAGVEVERRTVMVFDCGSSMRRAEASFLVPF